MAAGVEAGVAQVVAGAASVAQVVAGAAAVAQVVVEVVAGTASVAQVVAGAASVAQVVAGAAAVAQVVAGTAVVAQVVVGTAAVGPEGVAREAVAEWEVWGSVVAVQAAGEKAVAAVASVAVAKALVAGGMEAVAKEAAAKVTADGLVLVIAKGAGVREECEAKARKAMDLVGMARAEVALGVQRAAMGVVAGKVVADGEEDKSVVAPAEEVMAAEVMGVPMAVAVVVQVEVMVVEEVLLAAVVKGMEVVGVGAVAKVAMEGAEATAVDIVAPSDKRRTPCIGIDSSSQRDSQGTTSDKTRNQRLLVLQAHTSLAPMAWAGKEVRMAEAAEVAEATEARLVA